MTAPQRKKPAPGGVPAGYNKALGGLYSNYTDPETSVPISRPLDTLLSRLDRVRETGRAGEFWASCPSPDHGKGNGDRSPSLHVTETPDNRVLIRCAAGCATESVLSAVGLKFRDLYPTPHENLAAREAAFSHAASRMRARVDPLEHERLVLEIVRADLAAGKELSVEDRARVKLALERLGGAQ